MNRGKAREDITLLDVLIDGFEKNEILDGFHWRDLPMPDETSAGRIFERFVEEATRWKGPAVEQTPQGRRRLARWPDLEIRQAGRGVLVRARAPWFSDWWHDAETWTGDPMREVHEWMRREREHGSR
jgi:hypothetical protein